MSYHDVSYTFDRLSTRSPDTDSDTRGIHLRVYRSVPNVFLSAESVSDLPRRRCCLPGTRTAHRHAINSSGRVRTAIGRGVFARHMRRVCVMRRVLISCDVVVIIYH